MHKKFEVNWTKIKGGCKSYTKAAPQESENDLGLTKKGRGKSLLESWDTTFLPD